MNSYLQAFTALVLVVTVHCQEIPDLREFRSLGYGGVFSFHDDVLEEEIQKRLVEFPGFPLSLLEPKVWMFISEVTDLTLSQEIGIDISFTLPVRMGDNEGDLQLAHFTDNERFLNPYLVNYEEIKVVDRIEVESNRKSDLITMIKGPDVMVIEVLKFGYAKRGVNEALLKRQADEMRIKTDFPHPLDWGCSQMDKHNRFYFCDILEAHGFGVGNTDPNVCNINRNVEMNDDGQFYEIVIHHMTGYFTEQLPFIKSLPMSTEFAFYGHVEEIVGILYPCVL